MDRRVDLVEGHGGIHSQQGPSFITEAGVRTSPLGVKVSKSMKNDVPGRFPLEGLEEVLGRGRLSWNWLVSIL